MDVSEVKTKTSELRAALTALVQTFETQTGCIVHSVPVERTTSPTPTPGAVKAGVKIQIAE